MSSSPKHRRWHAAATVDWLLDSGRFHADAGEFTAALAARLLDDGLDISRLRISLHTQHPQLTGLLYTWRRGSDMAEEFRAAHGIRSTPAYRGSPIEFVQHHEQSLHVRLDALADDAHPVLRELAAEGGRDYLAVPVRFSNREVNTVVVVTENRAGFSASAQAELEGFMRHLAPVLEVIAERRNVQSLMETYVGPRSAQRVLAGHLTRGHGELIDAALWFSDLRDFTRLTEALPPTRMLDLMNNYFQLVSDAVTPRGGEILRFIGDAMLVVFERDDCGCDDALKAALDAFVALDALNADAANSGLPAIGFGVGLHVGEVVYGNVGARDRLDFTVMGSAVNRVARLESLTRELDCPLLFSADFAAQISRPVRKLGNFMLRGIDRAQAVYTITEGVPAAR